MRNRERPLSKNHGLPNLEDVDQLGDQDSSILHRFIQVDHHKSLSCLSNLAHEILRLE
jgi:hypothetical protein